MVLFPLSHKSHSQTQVTLPTTILETADVDFEDNPILIPAWKQISLSDLPPIQSSGEALGRTWRKGQTPNWFLNLGDLANALEVQVLSLESIEASLPQETDLSEVQLTRFPLAGQQTLEWLIDSVPGLKIQVIHNNRLLQNLVQKSAKTIEPEMTLVQLLKSNPVLGNVQLNEIDLAKYTVRDIPNLVGIPLEKFVGWQETLVKDIPGLSALPLGSYPVPVEPRGDLVLEIVEVGAKSDPETQKTMLSGSSAYGFEVPCKNCQSIKLGKLKNEDDPEKKDTENEDFYYWVGGAFQQLEGGYGCLVGGQEPTGRHPFGEAFKVVLTRLEDGQVETSAYFRWANDCGATPYNVGPIPLLTYGENSALFIGREISQQERDLAELNPDAAISRPEICQRSQQHDEEASQLVLTVSGIEVRAATLAIAEFFSIAGFDYDSIGAYGCNSRGTCGRRLGKYGVFSQDADLQRGVDPKWLARIESVTQSALLNYFPPVQQDEFLFNRVGNLLTQLSRKNDPSTGRPFEGEHLLTRLVLAYLGGKGVQVEQAENLTAINHAQTLEEAAQKIKSIYLDLAVNGGQCNG